MPSQCETIKTSGPNILSHVLAHLAAVISEEGGDTIERSTIITTKDDNSQILLMIVKTKAI